MNIGTKNLNKMIQCLLGTELELGLYDYDDEGHSYQYDSYKDFMLKTSDPLSYFVLSFSATKPEYQENISIGNLEVENVVYFGQNYSLNTQQEATLLKALQTVFY